MDFGLRSIKSIIKIAESYLKQCKGLQYNEVPDFITEIQMKDVPWQSNAIIKDLI
jgi:hypothetical protein